MGWIGCGARTVVNFHGEIKRRHLNSIKKILAIHKIKFHSASIVGMTVYLLVLMHCKNITNNYGVQKWPKFNASFGIEPKNILGTLPKTQPISVDFILGINPLNRPTLEYPLLLGLPTTYYIVVQVNECKTDPYFL